MRVLPFYHSQTGPHCICVSRIRIVVRVAGAKTRTSRYVKKTAKNGKQTCTKNKKMPSQRKQDGHASRKQQHGHSTDVVLDTRRTRKSKHHVGTLGKVAADNVFLPYVDPPIQRRRSTFHARAANVQELRNDEPCGAEAQGSAFYLEAKI